MIDYTPITNAVIAGNETEIVGLTQEALAQGAPPADIIEKGLVPGMTHVGEKFEINEMYIPDMLLAARAMHASLRVLRPLLKEGELKPVGKVVIGTVKGDLHDIGKNLVAWTLEGAGFEVRDLGVDVAPEDFVAAVRTEGAGLLCLSALLTTAMPQMAKVIQALQESGLRKGVKILVGGAPVTPEFADKIGADGYSPTSFGAVAKARQLLGLT